MLKKTIFFVLTASLLCSCAVTRTARPLDHDEAMISFMSPGSERVRVLIDNQLYDRRTVRVSKYYSNPFFKRTTKNSVNVGPGVHDVRVYNNNGNAVYQEGVVIINNENKTVNIYNQQQTNDPQTGKYANPQPSGGQVRSTGGQSAATVNDVRGASSQTSSKATTTTGSSSRATGSNTPAASVSQPQPAQQKATTSTGTSSGTSTRSTTASGSNSSSTSSRATTTAGSSTSSGRSSSSTQTATETSRRASSTTSTNAATGTSNSNTQQRGTTSTGRGN